MGNEWGVVYSAERMSWIAYQRVDGTSAGQFKCFPDFADNDAKEKAIEYAKTMESDYAPT